MSAENPAKSLPDHPGTVGVLSREIHQALSDERLLIQQRSIDIHYCIESAMPTVLRFNGLRVVIYPSDHRPAHVHVMGAGCETVFQLNCPSGPPMLRENLGFAASDLSRIKATLADHLIYLCQEWGKIHGQP